MLGPEINSSCDLLGAILESDRGSLLLESLS